MIDFHIKDPSLESQWRAIILFGKNLATYKFAFAKAILELSSLQKTVISLKDLSEPFSRNIIEHLKTSDKQGNFNSSKFIDSCKSFIKEEISKSELLEKTEQLGFVNVVDAFHNVNGESILNPFYRKDYKGNSKNIIVTDDLFKLKESIQYNNLPIEVEARWNLVETAWNHKISVRLLEVKYDNVKELFYLQPNEFRRIDVTSSRDSLNGYQKGKCFYCFKDISIISGNDNLCEVDHFVPHTYGRFLKNVNINGVWNLVLACKYCNGEKLARIPDQKYLERLSKRNEYYIESKHPLAETIIKQTGKDNLSRIYNLKSVYQEGLNYAIHRWEPKNEIPGIF